MEIDINEIIAQMAEAIKGSVEQDWIYVKHKAATFLEERKSRLELLASLRLTNQIEQKFFELRLQDEKDILESELHSLALITKVVAQNAANAAIEVLRNAVESALDIII
ncbi:MAG TPA: hypothetical protein VFQ50_08945 [Flavobacterium sp.]|jgi:hypothetical protein|nr:hypothetical protein [Flavobacterium sp.]